MKIKINGKYWEYFDRFTISTNLDSVASTFSFITVFDPANPAHKDLFKPLQYYKTEFFHDNGKVFATGTLLNGQFASKALPEPVSISGYSLGGILEDCQIPVSAYPLESNKRTLKEITERLLGYFGLKVIVYDTAAKACNEVIEKSVADPSETVKDYISKVAAQKNVIFSHDIHGNLIFFKPATSGKSKGLYTKENTLEMYLEVNGQALHSQLTTLRQPEDRERGEDTSEELTQGESIQNPLVNKFRPAISILTSGAKTDTSHAVKNAFGAELQNIKVTLVFDKWQPLSIGDIIEVQNEKLYIGNRARMMVQNTTMSQDSRGENMSITLVLPEVFSGETPKNIFA
jgi:prophage tail gpP-like protein